MKKMIIFPIYGLMITLVVACTGKTSTAQPPPSPLVKILMDRTLWGKDYPAALAYMPSWSKVGETKVAVFSDQVIGVTPYETLEEAEQKANELSRAMQEPQPAPTTEFEDFLNEARQNPPPFRAEALVFEADGSARVAWTGSSLQFLATELTLGKIEQEYGPPTQVTRELEEAEVERRPIFLVVHHYFSEAIDFVEVDLAPGLVNRAVLDLQALTSVVFR